MSALGCPLWCRDHYPSDTGVVHVGRVTVGRVHAVLERDDQDGPQALRVGVPDDDGFYGPSDARDLAAALTRAVDLIEQAGRS